MPQLDFFFSFSSVFEGVNNCVGERNQKHFLLFLLYIFICALYSAVLVGARMYQCGTRGTDACGMGEEVTVQLVFSIILLFESLLFGLFVIIMFGDQLNGISKNQTGIDRLKGNSAPEDSSTFFQKFAQVFGGGEFNRSWLLPVPPPIRMPEWYP